MSVNSILSALLGAGLQSKASITRHAEGVTLTINGIEKELRFSCPKVDEDISKFAIWCVRPADAAESAIRTIKDRLSEGRTLGYVFPVTSFCPDSDFCAVNLPGGYAGLYAGAAALALTESGVGNAHVRVSFDTLSDHTSLREIFDPDLAVVVIGRENLEKHGRSEFEIRLLLQEKGYFTTDLPESYSWSRPSPIHPTAVFVLGHVSSDVHDAIDLVSRLVSLAATQSSAVASLLIYYQVVEILSEKLLASRLKKLVAVPPLGGAWELREALREALSERSRVKFLCGQAESGNDHEVFSQLRLIGVGILSASAVAFNKDVSAAEVLYAVRNLVVHNQSSLPDSAHGLLNEFVKEFHLAVFAMVRRMDLSVLC